MPEEQTIGQLVAATSRDLSNLIHNEIELAKAELRDDAKAAARGGAMLGAAAFLGVLVVILLSIAAAYGLVALGLHEAVAFVIVAVVYLLVAALLVFIGIKAMKTVKPPERSIRAAKETAGLVSSEGRAEATRP